MLQTSALRFHVGLMRFVMQLMDRLSVLALKLWLEIQKWNAKVNTWIPQLNANKWTSNFIEFEKWYWKENKHCISVFSSIELNPEYGKLDCHITNAVDCAEEARKQGYQLGTESISYSAKFSYKGCRVYTSGDYKGQVFYGAGGKVADIAHQDESGNTWKMLKKECLHAGISDI